MNCHPGKGEHKAKQHDDTGQASAIAKACKKSARNPALDYLSGAMLIEDVRHHYGHNHYDEGPDLATGALSFSTPVLARQMGDIGSGKSERAETTTRPKRR
jgi:hypothetical protein